MSNKESKQDNEEVVNNDIVDNESGTNNEEQSVNSESTPSEDTSGTTEPMPGVDPLPPVTNDEQTADNDVKQEESSESKPQSEQESLEGDAVYVDHHGKRHGAFIEHLIAGGERVIAQLRLAMGGSVDEVPHRDDEAPHSWHRN